MSHLKLALAGVSALALSTAANAAVVGSAPNANLQDGPLTFQLDADTSYTFSYQGPAVYDPFSFTPVIAVRTTGTAEVFTTNINPNAPTTFFTDDDRRPFIPEGLLGQFNPFPIATIIPDPVDAFIALAFTLSDGLHYGYARINGNLLLSFAYETEAGVGLRAGDAITGPIPAPVPEPAALALLGMGVLGVAVARRRTR